MLLEGEHDGEALAPDLLDPYGDDKPAEEAVAEQVPENIVPKYYKIAEPEADADEVQGNEMPFIPDVPPPAENAPEPAVYIQAEMDVPGNAIDKLYVEHDQAGVIGGYAVGQPAAYKNEEPLAPGLQGYAPEKKKKVSYQGGGFGNTFVDLRDAKAESKSHARERVIRGMMVFYINVGNLAPGEALDLMDKVKEKYQNTERMLKANAVEVMWLPRTTGETTVDYFSFGL